MTGSRSSFGALLCAMLAVTLGLYLVIDGLSTPRPEPRVAVYKAKLPTIIR
ncbi:hypothetical protein [Alsobacter sp. R-9]